MVHGSDMKEMQATLLKISHYTDSKEQKCLIKSAIIIMKWGNMSRLRFMGNAYKLLFWKSVITLSKEQKSLLVNAD